jgi:hypothetical protein
VAGTDFDRITVNGPSANLTLGGTSALTLNFSALSGANNPSNALSLTNPFWEATEAWTIIALTGGASNSTLFASITNPTFTAGSFSLQLDPSNQVQLVFAPVNPTPEPGWVLLLAAGGGAAVWLRRWIVVCPGRPRSVLAKEAATTDLPLRGGCM